MALLEYHLKPLVLLVTLLREFAGFIGISQSINRLFQDTFSFFLNLKKKLQSIIKIRN